MVFIETSIFTREIQWLLPDESYRMLQSALMLRPDAGSVIRGSGGLRKIRWNLPGSGKRGGFASHLLLESSRYHLHAFSVSKNRPRRSDVGTAQAAPKNGKGVFVMKQKDFEKLVASIKEAGEIKAGHKEPSRVYEIKPPEIKTVREKLHVSQNDFALMIGVSVRTLQNWEQGRRKPEGPAKALLRVASRNPNAVFDALHAE
jgi:putative transcriptional regulator